MAVSTYCNLVSGRPIIVIALIVGILAAILFPSLEQAIDLLASSVQQRFQLESEVTVKRLLSGLAFGIILMTFSFIIMDFFNSFCF